MLQSPRIGEHMTPVDAVRWAEEHMLFYFTLGEFKTPERGEA